MFLNLIQFPISIFILALFLTDHGDLFQLVWLMNHKLLQCFLLLFKGIVYPKWIFQQWVEDEVIKHSMPS